MPVYREKERVEKTEKTSRSRDASISRKVKREIEKDERPIVTQDKSVKLKSSLRPSREKSKTDKSPTAAKTLKRKSDVDGKNGKVGERSGRTGKEITAKIKRDSKTNIIYLKDVLENKVTKKEEKKDDEKKIRSKKVGERKESEETKKREESSKDKRDRRRTRTLSPTEIKQLIPEKITSQELEGKPVKPVVPKAEESEEFKEEEGGEADEEYEDDFEDYESDFEEDDSESLKNYSEPHQEPENFNENPETVKITENVHEMTQETSAIPQKSVEIPQETVEVLVTRQTHVIKPIKLAEKSKKSIELSEEWKFNVQKRQIEEIKKSIEKENMEVTGRRNFITNLVEPESGPEQEQSNRHSGKQIIDFSMISKRQRKEKEAEAARKRGRDLLNMISLDAITYAIMEIPPIPYESYMKAFGKSNTKQVHVQTNEDDLEEEIQTDEILTCNKWTQHPPEYLGSTKTGNEIRYVLSKEERLGVGGDLKPEDEEGLYNKEVVIQPKTAGLLTFLSWASQVVLAALERKTGNFLNLEKMPKNSSEIVFGDGFVRLNVSDLSLLKGRSVTQVCLLNRTNKRLLSVHSEKNKNFQKNFLCVWSFREISKPLKVLVASNRVTSCCFGPNQGNLVFSGLSDGSVCLYDLREPSMYHNQLTEESTWTLQSPTYTTAGNFDESDELATIVSVQLVTKIEELNGFKEFTPLQICSLDKNGTVTMWSVVQLEKTRKNEPSEDLGLAHWGRLKLVKSSVFKIFDSLRNEIPGLYIACNDMFVSDAEDDGLYIANSFGSVQHISAHGSLKKPNFYVPLKQDAIIEITCLEKCPFNENYFLVGCGDGSVRLHSRHQETPLITLNPSVTEGQKNSAVVSLSWLQTRPCVFFVLDSMSRIHIWDLGVSDMYPDISLVLTEKKITCMKLQTSSDPKDIPFIVVATEDGDVEIHRLRKEYGCKSAADLRNETKMFLKYVSIL